MESKTVRVGFVTLVNGKVKKIKLTRETLLRHAGGLREVNEYNRRHHRTIYTNQAALNLIAGWVYDEDYESYCDSKASSHNEADYQ